MKKYSKLFIVFFLCSIILTGCNTSKEEAKVYYLNFKPEVADVWEEIAELYTQETGVEVKILTAPSNGNAQALKAEIATSIILSSGSFVVSLCIQSPGAAQIRTNKLSCFPAYLINS